MHAKRTRIFLAQECNVVTDGACMTKSSFILPKKCVKCT